MTTIADGQQVTESGPIIEARELSKRYGSFVALDRVSFSLRAGRIVGMIGRNGAGKTTALKAILGLTSCEGSVRVFGLDPARERNALMSDVCFIADAAVLPRWLSVEHAIDYVAGVHPRFDRKRAEAVLATTNIRRRSRIGELSKGMITQLHLTLILAINARLLVLDADRRAVHRSRSCGARCDAGRAGRALRAAQRRHRQDRCGARAQAISCAHAVRQNHHAVRGSAGGELRRAR
jgi:ABC-type glutathione transport system ATPase component